MVVGVFVRTQHRRGETASVLTDDSAAKYGAIPPQVTPRTEGDTSGLWAATECVQCTPL
jgi:hypothetical protein